MNDNNVTPANTTTTTVSPYYFRFKLNGVTDTFSGDNSKSYTTNTNGVLSTMSASAQSLEPEVSLRFSLPLY